MRGMITRETLRAWSSRFIDPFLSAFSNNLCQREAADVCIPRAVDIFSRKTFVDDPSRQSSKQVSAFIAELQDT